MTEGTDVKGANGVEGTEGYGRDENKGTKAKEVKEGPKVNE
jgi:hypothetical protein